MKKLQRIAFTPNFYCWHKLLMSQHSRHVTRHIFNSKNYFVHFQFTISFGCLWKTQVDIILLFNEHISFWISNKFLLTKWKWKNEDLFYVKLSNFGSTSHMRPNTFVPSWSWHLPLRTCSYILDMIRRQSSLKSFLDEMAEIKLTESRKWFYICFQLLLHQDRFSGWFQWMDVLTITNIYK